MLSARSRSTATPFPNVGCSAHLDLKLRSPLYHQFACRSCPTRCSTPVPVCSSSSRCANYCRATRLRLLGQRRIAELTPSLDRTWIETQQQLTTEIREFRRVGGRFEFAGLPEVTKLIEKSRIAGAALETIEIRDIVLVADRAAEWREIVRQPPAAMRSEWTAVSALSAAIQDFTGFLRMFRNKILPDGTLDDRASPELGRIRREIEKQRRLIQESLRGYLRRLAEGGTVQDELITIRGERFVIPVKVEQKRRVQGVVHGASSSGQTVFVEPLETIEQNNELVRLLDEEQAEIHRILLEMTRSIGENAEAILAAADVLAELELQFAKARFAEDYNCVQVRLCERRASSPVRAGRSPASPPPRPPPLARTQPETEETRKLSPSPSNWKAPAANSSSPAPTPAAKPSR